MAIRKSDFLDGANRILVLSANLIPAPKLKNFNLLVTSFFCTFLKVYDSRLHLPLGGVVCKVFADKTSCSIALICIAVRWNGFASV